MGFRFRKSVKMGPFRMTASKSGLSYSLGGNGFRVTKQANGKIRKTYSVPGTGISYSETMGHGAAAARSGAPARPVSRKSKGLALLLCILLGYVGAHRYYVGKVGSGIIYTLTCGGFMIGWIIDLVSIATNNFTDAQGNVLCGQSAPPPVIQPGGTCLPGDDVPIPTTRKEAEFVAPQWLRIAQESANICNNTVNPDVFFSRYDLMELTLRRLAAIEHFLSFSDNLPSSVLEDVQAQRSAAIRDMIERSYQREQSEAQKLKTETGRENRMRRYFETMNQFSEQLGPDGMSLLHELMAQNDVRI